MAGGKSKKNSSDLDEIEPFVNEVQQENGAATQWVIFIVIGVLTAGAVVSFFVSSGQVTAIVGMFLSIAYHDVSKKHKRQICSSRELNTRGLKNEEKSELEADFKASTDLEATMYSVFCINVVYTVLALSALFYLLPPYELSTITVCFCSTLAPAVAVVLLAKSDVVF